MDARILPDGTPQQRSTYEEKGTRLDLNSRVASGS